MTPVRMVAPLGAVATFAIFGLGAAAFYVATRPLLSALVRAGLRPELAWFICGSVLFGALLVVAVVVLAREGWGSLRATLVVRCRFRHMQKRDWLIAGAATAATLVLIGLLQATLPRLLEDFSPHPPFLRMTPFAAGERVLLFAWLPMFALNIFGEELLWHGYLLPRNVARHGRLGWLVNATGWMLFHVPLGLHVMLLVAPIVFIETWAVQRTSNTWVGVLIHALLNGPAFVAIALGALPA